MTATPQKRLESRLKTLTTAVEEDEEVATEDADAIRLFVDAYRPDNLMESPPGDESTLDRDSLATYVHHLTAVARDISLIDAGVDEVNAALQDQLEVQGAWTVHTRRTALRKFYRFHDFGLDADAIASIETPDGSTYDADDVLTREEIHELLDAADNPRDRVVFALLVYTGMRNGALRALRVGDVDPRDGATGSWKVPSDGDGLKGLGKHGKKRPLLGAQKPVRDWLSYHSASDDPDAYLITGRPKYGKANPHQPVDGSTIRRILNKLVKNTGNPALERKPTHPHMMRHTFVTVCKRDYELPDETVLRLIGHVPGSKVMETTYSHLDDEAHIKRTEVGAGLRDPEEESSPLTPPACLTCGEPLKPTAKACPDCGRVYTPDAHAVKAIATDIEEEATERAIERDPTENELDRAVREAASDPDAFMRRFSEVVDSGA